MKTEYFYYTIEIINPEGKTFAYAERVHQAYNLYGYFDRFCNKSKGEEIISITPFSTLKQARAVANFWNDTAREKGTCIV